MVKPFWSFIFLCLALFCPAAPAVSADWKAFQRSFVSDDGRVLDLFQNSISHSEGQGYGLLLALMNDDRQVFERIVRWTTDNLQVRRDALLAWSWGRRPNGGWSVIDYNNASDGDVLFAFALLKAAERWQHPPFRDAGLRMVRDIRSLLALTIGDHQLIAPAYFGFNGETRNVFNTGYLIQPAYAEFARVDDDVFWKRVLRDSRRLLEKSAFSGLRLPADWVALENERVTPAASREPFFGYEAIRAPLYLAWQNDQERLRAFEPYLQFVERAGYLPRRVNLIDGTVSVEEAPAGFYAVMALCADRLGLGPLARKLNAEADAKIGREPRDYFSNTLFLLSRGKWE